MNTYILEKPDPNHLLYTITIPALEFDSAIDQYFRKNRDKFNVPGVRPGKATRKMVESYFGRKAFKPAIDKIVSDAYGKAAAEYPEEILFMPTVRVVQDIPGRDFVFSAHVKVNPEAELCDYRKIEIPQEQVDDALKTAADLPVENRAATRRYLLQNALINTIAANSDIEVPDTLVNERAIEMANAFDQQLAGNNKTLDDYYKECNTDENALLRDFADAAEKQLRMRLTLLAIARNEGLEATDEEYDQECRRLAENSLLPYERVKELFAKHEIYKVRRDIAISKGADFIGRMIDERWPASEEEKAAEKKAEANRAAEDAARAKKNAEAFAKAAKAMEEEPFQP